MFHLSLRLVNESVEYEYDCILISFNEIQFELVFLVTFCGAFFDFGQKEKNRNLKFSNKPFLEN